MLNYEKIAFDKHGQAFIDKLKSIAVFLGIPYKWLLGVMWSESGLNPYEQNTKNFNGTYDTGIIQFNDITAIHLGTSRDSIKNMSALQQLDLVKVYYTPIKGKVKSFGDLYLYNLSPALFYTPNVPQAIEFKKRVTNRYKADTGQNPDKANIFTLKNVLIVICVLVFVYWILSLE